MVLLFQINSLVRLCLTGCVTVFNGLKHSCSFLMVYQVELLYAIIPGMIGLADLFAV